MLPTESEFSLFLKPESSWAAPYKTDYAGWRLKVSEDSHGQQKWVYLPPGEAREKWPQTTVDKYWLGLDTELPVLETPKTPMEAARNGLRFYRELQSEDGHFASEYGGPLFLTPGLVIAMEVTGQSFTRQQKSEMIRYLLNRRQPDGGWGLHTAAPSTAWGVIMNYVALRLLGMGPDEGPMTEIRGLIHKMGGATTVPTWGKVWLSVLGAYEWEGVGPIPPELWLLPDWVPFAPWRWWIHVRNVFTPMSYLWGTKFVGQFTPLVFNLRQEIYTQPYDSIRWSAQQSNINPLDIYCPHSKILDFAHKFIGLYDMLPNWVPEQWNLRSHANEAAYRQVVYEDENTGYQTLGPVSKAFNMVVRYAKEGPDSDAFKAHLTRIDDFLWISRDGMFMAGTNGSQLWDLAFLAQAMVETGLAEEKENKSLVLGMLDWLDKCQIRVNPPHLIANYRHISKGAWPFSTPEQSYTVSDCTAEGLKAAMAMQALNYAPSNPPISLDRMHEAVDILLSMQNAHGGFASYELTRGSDKLEWLNAAEMFGNIMIDYSYPECSTSALSALKYFTKLDSQYRADEISNRIDAAIDYIHRVQRPDGSWYGSWGICFTYATMFALESLGIAGETYANSESVRRACEFLLSKQMEDGGWGETYMSCVNMVYSQHEQAQVVQTAWSILALIYAKCPNYDAIRRAVKLIMSRQMPDGQWAQEDTEGIFNKNCGINYPAFKFIFCIWALGRADKYLSAAGEA